MRNSFWCSSDETSTKLVLMTTLKTLLDFRIDAFKNYTYYAPAFVSDFNISFLFGKKNVCFVFVRKQDVRHTS